MTPISISQPRIMAAATDDALCKLAEWFQVSGGQLHPSLALKSSSNRGSYLAATEPNSIASATVLLSFPLQLTLSILNIPNVAPYWPLAFVERFRNESHVLSRFLVMEAWLQRSCGFWWPYLKAIPQPQSIFDPSSEGIGPKVDPFDTPLYWTAGELAWLKGTQLGTVTETRQRQWQDEFSAGLAFFKDHIFEEALLAEWRERQESSWQGYSWFVGCIGVH